MKNKTLFIFVDESGNFDFSYTGTKHFVITSITTFNPLNGRENLDKARYRFLTEGKDIEYFHATKDKQVVRDEAFNFIGGIDDFEIDTVIVQKDKTNPSLYSSEHRKKKRYEGYGVYSVALRSLLQYVFRRYEQGNMEKVIVILSSIFTKNKQELILKTIKSYLKKYFDVPFFIYFHNSRSDKNCQIADYCCWAIYVKWERDELRPYNAIEEKVKSEFDIFKCGQTKYY